MARIDRFMPLLNQPGAECVALCPGEKVALIVRGTRKSITTDPLTASQIDALLDEIRPKDAQGATEFTHATPLGAVTVVLTGEAPAIRVELKLASASAAATVTTTAAVAAASGTAQTRSEPALVKLLRRMIQVGASDLHIAAGNPPQVRKDGDIVPLDRDTALSAEQTRELLFGITPARQREVFESSHDVDFSYEIPGLARFRCNLFTDRTGMGGVFRIIPAKIPSAEQLGLSKAVLELCHLNKGLVVVTGPTGSGKSTTLAAMIDYVNRNRNAHLITIEDPIEFVHQNHKCLINQREIGNHTLGFKQALRAALREDPDIVLVGEMRDLETVAIAIETAETGHLVFGTLHTNTAPSTVDRMIDQFPSDRQAQVRTMLSESLKGVIAQTLCKKKGGGRVAAQEVLLVNSAVSNLIREGKTFQIQSIMQTGKAVGMVCMNDALCDLVRGGLVEPDEACARSANKVELKTMLARGGVAVASA